MTTDDRGAAALRQVLNHQRADRIRAASSKPSKRNATSGDVLHLALGRELPDDVDPGSLDGLGGGDAA